MSIEQSALQPRLYYRAKEVAALLGLSLRTVYEGVYAGWIPSRKIGNSRLIPAVWLQAASDEQADQIANRFTEEQAAVGKSDNSGFVSVYRMQQHGKCRPHLCRAWHQFFRAVGRLSRAIVNPEVFLHTRSVPSRSARAVAA